MEVCIQVISNGESKWFDFPNEDLKEEISNFVRGRDWKVVSIESKLHDNNFDKCDIFELNEMLLNLEKSKIINTERIEDLVIINMMLEDQNHNCKCVEDIIFFGNYIVFHNVKDMGDIARIYLEENSNWYKEALKSCSWFDRYIDFKSYGEEVIAPNGTWLHDERYNIAIEIID